MTAETLVKAKEIYCQIECIEDAIYKFESSKKGIFGYETFSDSSFNSSFVSLPERCQEIILEQLKKQLEELKKEFKSL